MLLKKKYLFLLLFITFIVSVGAWTGNSPWGVSTSYWGISAWKTPTDIAEAEATVLKDFYEATSGDEWSDNTNWGTTETADDWYGVTVVGGHVHNL